MRVGIYAKLVFMDTGGIARVACMLANYLADIGDEVILYHGKKNRKVPVYSLNKRIITHELNFNSSLEKVRGEISNKELDVICVMSSDVERLYFIQLLHGLNIPLVFSEHMDPSCVIEYYLAPKSREFCFKYADALHFLCHNFVKNLPGEFKEKTFVIPNSPFWDSVECIPYEERNASRIILTMARLQEFHKRTSILIKAFRLLQIRYPDWKCVICGDGTDRLSYAKMVTAYGLQEKVILTGAVSNVRSYYKTASLFCLPSAFEGLPCAMIEAQCYGIPSVGFASCAGVNEIIQHGENGLLADSLTPESLAACLDRLMGNGELRQRMRRRSLELSHRYDKESVLAQWRTLLEYAAAKKGHTALDAAPAVVFPADEKELKPRAPLIAQQLRASLKLAQEVAELSSRGGEP